MRLPFFAWCWSAALTVALAVFLMLPHFPNPRAVSADDGLVECAEKMAQLTGGIDAIAGAAKCAELLMALGLVANEMGMTGDEAAELVSCYLGLLGSGPSAEQATQMCIIRVTGVEQETRILDARSRMIFGELDPDARRAILEECQSGKLTERAMAACQRIAAGKEPTKGALDDFCTAGLNMRQGVPLEFARELCSEALTGVTTVGRCLEVLGILGAVVGDAAAESAGYLCADVMANLATLPASSTTQQAEPEPAPQNPEPTVPTWVEEALNSMRDIDREIGQRRSEADYERMRSCLVLQAQRGSGRDAAMTACASL